MTAGAILAGGPTPANHGPRLILRTDVLSQLLAAITGVPAGQRLHIPALRDALVNQGDVISGIETLIAAGELDPATLRPPKQPAGGRGSIAKRNRSPDRNWGDRPTGIELAERLDAEGKRRGLKPVEICRQVFGNAVQLWSLRKGPRPVTRSTLLKAEAWLARAPAALPDGNATQAFPHAGNGGEEPPKREPEAESTPPSAPTELGCRSAAPVQEARTKESAAALPKSNGSAPAKSAAEPSGSPPPPTLPLLGITTGPELFDLLIAVGKERGLSILAVSLAVFQNRGRIYSVRSTEGLVRKSTIDRAVAWLRSTPACPAAPAQPRGPARHRAQRARDLTSQPIDPALELADKQRLNGQRHQAAIRRGQEREATAKLESGEKPKNSFERSLMSGIERRREDEARLADPVEQAKLALQKRYAPVCSMAVHGGDPALFMVGSRKDVSRDQLLEMAARLPCGAPIQANRGAR